jgi:hypothetical protein
MLVFPSGLPLGMAEFPWLICGVKSQLTDYTLGARPTLRQGKHGRSKDWTNNF